MSDDEKLPSFALPTVGDSGDGWGPPSVAATPLDIPFAPYNKSDRLGRISDWTQNNRYRPGGRYQQFGQGSGAFRLENNEDDDGDFSLVDNKPKPKTNRFQRRPFQNYNNRRGGRGGWRGRGRGGWRGRGGRGGWQNRRGGRQGGRWGYNNWAERQAEVKDSSIPIDEDWLELENLPFDSLGKSNLTPPEGETILAAGTVELYNVSFDRLNPRNTVSLMTQKDRLMRIQPSTSDDPIMLKLAAEQKGNVFATDQIFAILMTATRSVNGWDVICRKQDGNLFLDLRPDSNLNVLSVNENWNEVQATDKDNVNNVDNLGQESTVVNHNFKQQVVKSSTQMKLGTESNPFKDQQPSGQRLPTGGYRYRRWSLPDGIKVVARCSVDAYTMKGQKPEFVSIRALFEFDSKLSGNVDWRRKLEQQTAAVLATEIKNNSFKLARWTGETMLSGSDSLRVGFVSRKHATSSDRHEILMTEKFTPPSAFAQWIQVRFSNLWGVLSKILAVFNGAADGNYVILKDPNEPQLKVFELPSDYWEQQSEDHTTEAKP